MEKMQKFREEYQRLNKAQKEAVDTIDGPVMVVAGPGTGKTQILALRIGRILKETDIKADGILCLTFTNSAVDAMKNRLKQYIGETAEKVNVFTFHSFGMKVIEEHFKVLDLDVPPKLLDDVDTAFFFDEILQGNDWQYLRPRADNIRYFSDLRSLISLLKRERVASKYFLSEVVKEIEDLQKSDLKKDLKKIEALERSQEVVNFFDLYEKIKKEKNVFDYDDVLENLVKIIELSPDALSDIREKYLYILVDEHQDSNAVQNEFLKLVWGPLENPDIFVVGDDRQLIYGFGGASVDHFQGFRKTFKNAKLVALTDNYRSTQVILDVSHALLESILTSEKLLSRNKEHHPIRLFRARSERDEILACAQDMRKKEGLNPSNCAILVPKNKQVRAALEILHGAGFPVSLLDALNLFDQEETQVFLRVLRIISNPDDPVSFALSFFDKLSGVPPLEAHKYIAEENTSEAVERWMEKLSRWKKDAQKNDLTGAIQIVGSKLFSGGEKNAGRLVSGQEILNTILLLAQKELEKNPDLTLAQFASFLARLESYGEHVPLAMEEREGVKVLTLHSSKGLEFDYVWIAHMDERSLNSGKKRGFVLPKKIAEKIEERDIDAVKRKLYVAITRAKRFCTLSYALYSGRGSEREVAKVIADLPEEILEKHEVKNAEVKMETKPNDNLMELTKLVEKKYKDRYVSVSLLNNFFECPWKWYFRSLLKLPEVKSESLEFGNAIHSAIDQILKSKKILTEKEIEKITGNNKEVFKIIAKWVKNRLPEISAKRENEKSISVHVKKFPHLSIYGKLDLVEELNEENVRVTDFKTGHSRTKTEIEKINDEGRMSDYLRQLVMYSFLLAQSRKKKINVPESRLEFLEAKNEKEKFYDTKITEEQINLLIQDIKDYDNLIKNGEWINRPCNYNSYGKGNECEYCQMAEIYKLG